MAARNQQPSSGSSALADGVMFAVAGIVTPAIACVVVPVMSSGSAKAFRNSKEASDAAMLGFVSGMCAGAIPLFVIACALFWALRASGLVTGPRRHLVGIAAGIVVAVAAQLVAAMVLSEWTPSNDTAGWWVNFRLYVSRLAVYAWISIPVGALVGGGAAHRKFSEATIEVGPVT